ncbi:MAG: PepSY-like domain-containing protein, partial [Aequorivita vladivostokensis]|nr:PepSY-like domain-containing protein [Aequorivita vladivostokensis]
LDGTFLRVDTDNDDDDENEIVLSEAEIPTEITAYLNQHFASNAIIRALKEMDDNTVEYEVYLDGDYELEFNENFEIISIEGITELPDSVIPQSILDYVTQNYPNDFIVEWELEDDHQQVELNNGIEIKFTLNGEFIRVDNE